MDIKIEYDKMKPERQEIFNYKESQGQEKFKMFTTNTNQFSNCFNQKSSLINQVEKWRNVLISFIKRSFKKIRIRNGGSKFTNVILKNLINKRNFLLLKKNKKCKFCDLKSKDQSNENLHIKTNHADKTHQEMCNCPENKKEIEQIESKIAELESEHNRNKILKNFKDLIQSGNC